MTDPIASMLTSIRNGLAIKKNEVLVPASKLKTEIARVLKESGYLRSYSVVEAGEDKIGKSIKLGLKYTKGGSPVISELQRVSKPGCRIYCEHGEIPIKRNGLGVMIISTTSGILTDRQAREKKLGGEIMISVA